MNKPTPPAMNAASPTDLSKRLREYANQSWKFSNINVSKADLLTLLDELDRLAAHVGQGSATIGEEFHKHLDKCSAEVATWPAWKRRGGFGQGSATTDAEQLQAHRADFDRKMADPLHRVLAERASGATSGEARRVTPEMRAALDSSKAEAAEIGARIEQMKEEFGLGSATSGEADEYSSREAAVLRRLLAWHVSGGMLYADDGELQDGTAWPYIDFKRDTVDAIETKLGERTRAALAAKAEQSSPLSPEVIETLNYVNDQPEVPASVPQPLAGVITLLETFARIGMTAEREGRPTPNSLLCSRFAAELRAFATLVAERAAAPASVPEGFALVPTEINAVIRIGFAYVDAAREADPRQKWAFSHAGWSALLAEAAAIAPEVAQPAAQGERTPSEGGITQAECEGERFRRNFLATPAPTAGEPSAKAQRNSEYDAISARARELYVVYVDWVERQGIHSNRLPGWGELSADERASWVSEARLHIKATQGGKDGA